MSLPGIAEARQRYADEIPPELLSELAELGFDVHRVGELRG